MQWIERNPLPAECEACQEGECYNCDTAGKRWALSKADDLRTLRTLKLQAIKRLQREVATIEEELNRLEK